MSIIFRFAALYGIFIISIKATAFDLGEINNFVLEAVDVDFHQEKCGDIYLSEEKHNDMFDYVINRYLVKSSNALPEQTLSLRVFVDVNRCKSSMTIFRYWIFGQSQGEIVFTYKSPTLTTAFSKFSKASDVYGRVTDARAAIYDGRHIVQVVSELTSGFKVDEFVDDDAKESLHQNVLAYVNAKHLYKREHYVSDKDAQPLIEDLLHAKDRKRIENYVRIIDDWPHQPKLKKAVEKQLNVLLADIDGSANHREIRYAMNALASFGDEKDVRIFNEMAKREGMTRNLIDEIVDSKNILSKRRLMLGVVHNTASFDRSQPWQVNQLANRWKLPVYEEVRKVVGEVEDKWSNNEYLLDKMANTLEFESRRVGERAIVRDDLYARICKLLANSGNKKYLPILQSVENHAVGEKARKYAKATRKKLSKGR